LIGRFSENGHAGYYARPSGSFPRFQPIL
jgi:hypothetical protein